MRKIAIIGASYLQLPLIRKAKAMGLETHVFAWAANDVGEKEADYFYPISIVEKEQILNQCRRIDIDGICSIASDLAMLTVNYVAQSMGLTGNTLDATVRSTNKNEMRKCFASHGDPSPLSVRVQSVKDLDFSKITFPVIVKPTDRSGSRGITLVQEADGLEEAVERACAQSFEKKALVEEFARGHEFSVECISWKGNHRCLAITEKFTTGAPGFIETGHLQPARLSEDIRKRVQKVVFHALDSLGLAYGASHSELKIDENGVIRIIEIGGRMGGDCIGSSLVELSTGYDFVKAVIDIALGEEPDPVSDQKLGAAAVRFIFDEKDVACLNLLKQNNPEMLVEEQVQKIDNKVVTDSSSRFGYFVFRAASAGALRRYLPDLL